MFEFLYPCDFCESIYNYDFELSFQNGKRVLLFDIDNTLVPHGAPATKGAKAFAQRLRSIGISMIAISNNHEERVKSFCDDLGIPYICDAGKPGKKAYEQALSHFGISREEAIFFGDQIFTDTWGANRSGIYSVLVKPIDKSTDEIQIVLKRMLEKPIIKAYLRKKSIDFSKVF